MKLSFPVKCLTSLSQTLTYKHIVYIEGDALSCFDYRAWDSGEPSHSRGCVGLIKAEHKSDPVWKVIPCGIELPFICEIPHSQQEEKGRRRMK
jgi:hypothetical protein